MRLARGDAPQQGAEIEHGEQAIAVATELELPDAPVPGVVGDSNRGSNPRQESITDIINNWPKSISGPDAEYSDEEPEP